MADGIFRKNCRRDHSILSHFSGRPRGNKNAANITSATLLLLPMLLVEWTRTDDGVPLGKELLVCKIEMLTRTLCLHLCPGLNAGIV